MRIRALAAAAVALLLATALASCDSFLERDPISDAGINEFYETEDDIVTALNSVYATLQNTPDNRWDGLATIYLYYGASHSDIASGGGLHGLDGFSLEGIGSDNQGRAGAIFHYNAIMRINTLLQEAPGVEMDEQLRRRLMAEARFVRAFWYFTMARVFGVEEKYGLSGEAVGLGVPLVTQRITIEEAYQTRRAPLDSVYAQVEQDLQYAIEHLPPSYGGDEAGRATRGAARTLLGKVYLTRERWEEAKEQLELVINSGQYRLVDEYGALWGLDNESNDEFIFTAEHIANSDNEGARFTTDAAPRFGAEPLLNGYGGLEVYRPSEWFVDQLDYFTKNNQRGARFISEVDSSDEGDLRSLWHHKWYLDDPEYDVADGDTVFAGNNCDQCYTKKWIWPEVLGVDRLDSPVDFPFFRYAEVLLMYAEAVNEINGAPTPLATEYLNRIRTRAGLEPYEQGLSYDAFWTLLQRERMFEFALEGKRWWDLIRTPPAHGGGNRWISIMEDAFEYQGQGNVNVEEHEVVLPLPPRVLEVNGAILQNPGYARPVALE